MKSYPAGLLLVLLVPTLVEAQALVPSYPPPAEVKAAFLKLLDRPKVPADPKQTILEGRSPTPSSTETVELLSIATDTNSSGIERVPLLIVKSRSATKKLPVVLVLHGTGGNKEGQRHLLGELAERGFFAVALDGRYHGARKGIGYNEAITAAWKAKPGETQEHPFYYDTCWDIWRTLDYLQTRPDVDPERIGVIGFSKGGIETWLAAAVDDRIKVAVPAIAVQSFRWSLDHDQWQGRARTIKTAHDAAASDLGEPAVNQRVCRELWNKVIPGMLDQFDCPSMLRLFAGRPLLILNGELDQNCPLGGAEVAFASVRQTYKEANAGDKLKIVVAPGVGHRVTDEQRLVALKWFERWLKPHD